MKRLAWIDNLRVMTIILVVILHTAVTYSGIGGWYYTEGHDLDKPSLIFFALFQSFTQAYFMSLLFMVSGFFSQNSLERKGAVRFIAGRLKRLGIPLLIFIFLIQPLTVMLAYPDLDMGEWYINGLRSFNFLGWTGPLWFVEALLIFALIYTFIYKIALKPGIQLNLKITVPLIIIYILLISIVAFLFRLAYPIGTNFYNLQFGFFSAYIFMFAAGILAHMTGFFEQIKYRDGLRWLIASLGIGIPTWILILRSIGTIDDDMLILGGWNWPAYFYALWESFFCVTFILALVGIFKHKLNISSRIQKFLSDQAFAVFVFHAPVLVAITMALRSWNAHPVIKFFVVFPLAVAASFFVSWLIRRVKPLKQLFS